MVLRGKVHLYGDHIDTDIIIPARYLNTTDPEELAKHCMEDARDDFHARVRPGDIIVGGENFGCGSSREHAPIALKNCGHLRGGGKKFRAYFLSQCHQRGAADFRIRASRCRCSCRR